MEKIIIIMAIYLEKISVKTNRREEIIDISSKVKEVVRKAVKKGIRNGICRVFVPHTTAGITINENADPAVEYDMVNILRKLVPQDPSYKHLEGNSDAHVKASMMGFMAEVLLADGSLILGTWQGIKFCEFDGPRHRSVYVQVMGEK